MRTPGHAARVTLATGQFRVNKVAFRGGGSVLNAVSPAGTSAIFPSPNAVSHPRSSGLSALLWAPPSRRHDHLDSEEEAASSDIFGRQVGFTGLPDLKTGAVLMPSPAVIKALQWTALARVR